MVNNLKIKLSTQHKSMMRFITSSSVVKSCCQIDWRKKDNVWVGFFRLWHLASDHLIRRCSIQNTRDTKHRKNCRVERSEWWIMNEWVSYPCRYRAARAAQTFQAQKIHFKHKKICFVRLWQVVSDDLIKRCPIQPALMSAEHWSDWRAAKRPTNKRQTWKTPCKKGDK